MKKNLNIIQIKGTKGLLMAVGFVCCLIAGFGYFPGWVCMKVWNLISGFIEQMPSIGIIQGLLLWGIIAASYFLFRKEKLVVCMRSSEGLSEDELKEVFADLKQQAANDTLIQSMLKAREAELRIRNLKENNIQEAKNDENSDNANKNNEILNR